MLRTAESIELRRRTSSKHSQERTKKREIRGYEREHTYVVYVGPSALTFNQGRTPSKKKERKMYAYHL